MTYKFGPVRNLDKVQSFIKELPRGTIRPFIIDFTKYIIGDEKHGLRHDDPYKQTTRKTVYGRTFESPAQRRYVMAAIKDGRIKIGQRKNTPTDASYGYGMRLTSNGYGATIYNDEEGAYWSRSWGGWKNWRNNQKVVAANIKGALRAGMAAANRWLKSKGK